MAVSSRELTTMSLDHRAAIALYRLRAGTDRRSTAQDEHALALALETMFRTGDARCFLSGGEVERYVSAVSGNGRRSVGRVVGSGAVEDFTNTPEGQSFHAAVGEGTVWRNARRVRLPPVTIDTGTTAGAITTDTGSSPRPVTIDTGQGFTIDTQMIGNYYSPLVGELFNYTNEGVTLSVEEYVTAMSPRSDVWNGTVPGDDQPNGKPGRALHSRDARAYAVVATAGRPVTPSILTRALDLDIGNRGAKDVLRNLGKHFLIRRSEDGTGWLPGPLSPDEHDPLTCPRCPESQTSQEAPTTGDGATAVVCVMCGSRVAGDLPACSVCGCPVVDAGEGPRGPESGPEPQDGPSTFYAVEPDDRPPPVTDSPELDASSFTAGRGREGFRSLMDTL